MVAKFEQGENTHLTLVEQEAEYSEGFRPTLKAVRDSAKVSQARLAGMAGFDHSYLSRLESGAREPSKDAVEALVGALGLDGVQADRLRASAGFRGMGNTISYDEPEMLMVNDQLRDPEISEDVKEKMRVILSALGSLAAAHSLLQEAEE